MSKRRRHANNFTDSLNSFLNVTGSEANSDTSYSISQDSLEKFNGVSIHTSNDATHSAKHSIILSGNSTQHFHKQDSSTSSQSKPDLNKRIDSIQTEQLCDKMHNDKENNNPQCSYRTEQSRNNDTSEKLTNTSVLTSSKTPTSHKKLESNIMNKSSKRDTNYNIHNKSANITLEQNVPKSSSDSESTSFSSCINEDILICDKNLEHEQAGTEVKKPESILCSLDNKLNLMNEISKSEVLKRLSNKFIHSPQDFTEKLLTIIEDSVINNDNDTCNTFALNLSRLTTEFRKMCKFIEDESAPEWVLSPPPISQCSKQILTSPTCNKFSHIKTSTSETLSNSPISKSTPIKPLSGIDIMRQRFFNKIGNNLSGSVDNIVNISENESSNASFERLEAQCERLFPEEKVCSKPLRRSSSVPSLLNMNQIKHICEEQLASLNVSTAINENDKEKVILNTPDLFQRYQSSITKTKMNCLHSQQEVYNRLKNGQHDKVSYSKKKSKKMSEKSDIGKLQSDKSTNSYAIVDPDELEKTLLQDIAEKRKRCLNTARLITEINADPEAIEAQKSLRMSPLFADDSESNSLTNDEAKFLKTLMSCKDYQTYLENQKPLFKLLENSNSCNSDTTLKDNKSLDLKYKTPDSKEGKFKEQKLSTKTITLSTNLQCCSPYKSPLLKKKGGESEKKKENIKPKLFITPGKTPPSKNSKRKKTYFPSLNSPTNSTVGKHILKSPHAEGLYRLNYNTIISPVGMYIRGTDMQLIKNVRAKKDDLLLTPVKTSAKISPIKNSKQSTPLKGKNKIRENLALKIAVSPKVETNCIHKPEAMTANTPENDNTPKNHFVLPKVSYQLPLQVKTIKENKSPKSGTRVKKLLECAQSKVVIRHQARVNSVQKQQNTSHDGVYEIHYQPEDESIHIEQAANKTNFICRRKND